ncbi:RNA polymerase sigma factor [Streptomyces sp. NPDC014846]|uniref:RNA polymerase sigma factor n=1 Tax=Streptomyces sp. NPDC014846 TaxID=3364922 RepID=UPI0036FCFFCF
MPQNSASRSCTAKHHAAVDAYVRRRLDGAHAVEDVVAEVFLTAWRRLEEVPRGAVLSWLYATERRLLVNVRRADQRRGNLAEAVARNGREHADDPAGGVAGSLAPARQAAKVLGCTMATFHVRLHRARTSPARPPRRGPRRLSGEPRHDVAQTLRSPNPVRTGNEADQAQLDGILATPWRSIRRPQRSRWAWTVAAAAVTAGLIGYVVVDPFGVAAQPALAATPTPLHPRHADRQAADVLEETAARIAGQADPRPRSGKSEHFIRDDWALSTRFDNVRRCRRTAHHGRGHAHLAGQRPEDGTRPAVRGASRALP